MGFIDPDRSLSKPGERRGLRPTCPRRCVDVLTRQLITVGNDFALTGKLDENDRLPSRQE